MPGPVYTHAIVPVTCLPAIFPELRVPHCPSFIFVALQIAFVEGSIPPLQFFPLHSQLYIPSFPLLSRVVTTHVIFDPYADTLQRAAIQVVEGGFAPTYSRTNPSHRLSQPEKFPIPSLFPLISPQAHRIEVGAVATVHWTVLPPL